MNKFNLYIPMFCGKLVNAQVDEIKLEEYEAKKFREIAILKRKFSNGMKFDYRSPPFGTGERS